jgi:hypothetical protein
MKKTNKIKALALGTGYAETSSWSQWFLVHRKGFPTLDAALSSLRECVAAYIEDERAQYPKLCDGLTVRSVIYEVIHGSMQDHGPLWEFLAKAGWDSTPQWHNFKIGKVTLVERADEEVAGTALDT